MTPETRLALYGGALALFGALLIAGAALAGRDHRKEERP